MNNILTIYKFEIPILNINNKIIFDALITDFKEYLIYNEIKFKIEKNDQNINFINENFKISFNFLKDKKYFYPIFVINFHFSDITKLNIFDDFIKIIEPYKLDDFIFDYDEVKLNYLKKYELNTFIRLKQNFNLIKFQDFFKNIENINKLFIEEYLYNDRKIFLSILYLQYLCFLDDINQNNILNLLNNLNTNNIDLNISLTKERLLILYENGENVFKKYLNLLDKLFNYFN